MPTMAATGKQLRIQVCSLGEKPRLGRYPKIRGYHAPQMKNSRTIIRNSLRRMARFMGEAASSMRHQLPQAKAAEVLEKSQELDDTEHQMLPFIANFRSIKEAVKQFGRI